MDETDGGLAAFNRMARRIRDESRPELEVAAAAIGEALARACAPQPGMLEVGLTGPERWSWRLVGSREITLSRSAREECLGHPLLTIREELYPPFDNQLVSSSIILGRDREGIVMNVLNLLLGHTAASAGMLAAAQSNIGGPSSFDVIDRIRGIGDGPAADGLVDAIARLGKNEPEPN